VAIGKLHFIHMAIQNGCGISAWRLESRTGSGGLRRSLGRLEPQTPTRRASVDHQINHVWQPTLKCKSARAVDLLLLCGAAATATKLCLAVGGQTSDASKCFLSSCREDRYLMSGLLRLARSARGGLGRQGSLQSRTSPSEERRGYAPH